MGEQQGSLWGAEEGLRRGCGGHVWGSKYDSQNNVKSGEFYVILRKNQMWASGGGGAGESRRSKVLNIA